MVEALLALAVAVGGPDLAVRDVSVSRSGDRLRVVSTVANVGSRRTRASRVEFPAGGRVIAVRKVGALAARATARRTVHLTRVSSVAVCVDGDCMRSLAAPAIGSSPADPTAATSARFAFRHSSRAVRFTCRLDDQPPSRCSSPVRYAGLSEGDHRFSVTATRARLTATTIARWTIDTTAPPAPALSGRPDALSNRRDAVFRFTDRDAEARFRCRVDGGPLRSCGSPATFSLADGAHTFAVNAVDRAGNAGAASTAAWSIDATPPPAPEFGELNGDRVSFSDAEPGVRFTCALDDGPAASCASPLELPEGQHGLTVTAYDAAGNGTATQRAWAVRLRPGVATGPPVTVQATSATVSGVVIPNNAPTSFYVEYGETTAYGMRSAVASAGSAPVEVPVQALLTGLGPRTTYHFRLVATSCGGCAAGTSRGADGTLTTPPPSTYQNPVYGGLADPMGLRDLGDFYAYGTGELFPVLHSTDLVHWEKAGTAMTRRPAWVPQTGESNPWAPSVLRRDGACPGTLSTACYFMYYTGLNNAVSPPANCIGVAISTSPAGPFTDTGILNTDPPSVDAKGRPLGCGDDVGYSNIDPAPFIDPADGRGYLYLSTGHEAVSGDWQRTVSVIGLAPDLVHAAGPRHPLFTMTRAWEGDVVEGPWMLRHGSAYYLLYSGGSFTNATYAMGYALGTSPTGPFAKPSPAPILKSTPEVIGPGGGSVVTGPRGVDWLLYHGRAVAGGPRTLRIDPLVWDDAADPPTLTVRGPTTTPQVLP
jgi:hypothetical protein